MQILVALGLAFGAPPAVAEPPHLVLISMDTTRADALSCYGTIPAIRRPLPQVTPNLDALAEDGVRFAHFYTHAPTTLNSHVSMMTGLDPHEHGVPSNGYVFSGDQETLAQRLSAEGYQTVAVVGAAALEKEMGLNLGFDIYDDRVTVKQKSMYQDTAEGVVRRVFQQLDGRNPSKPLFLFVHFYDPHGPLTPRPDYRVRFVDDSAISPLQMQPWSRGAYMKRVATGEVTDVDNDLGTALYLAEVSYMDHYIGEMVRGLKARGFLDRTVLAVTADHGQNLSEHGALVFSHGFDVHDEVMHIPLILRGYGVAVPSGRVVQRRFAMSGLAPTLERILGFSARLGKGRDFYSALRPGPVWDSEGWPSRPQWPLFFEATRPFTGADNAVWNNLRNQRAIRLGAHKLYHQPRKARGVYGLDFTGPKALGTFLGELLKRWDEGAPPHRSNEMELKTKQALEALGYVEPSSSSK